ncbi:cell death abnormality protein 1-like [Mercenaria mercenaria]|uniref:cell death abnormality protein 1-like n=1 Tax=Mercenaria mercenaria TaxID=6596 RepID=UPI00234E9278|nr:cell death abnormality protein 1-like [Mercenaria mercenaria]XP_053387667.1 cell death abnormality protein 1-like [Mercenaria mercenaria]
MMSVYLKLLGLVLCKTVFTQYACNVCSCCKNGRSGCNFVGGTCIYGCIPGFYGSQCRNACSTGCLICSDNTNRCISCKNGFYREQQQSDNEYQYSYYCHACRSNCVSCVTYNECTACIDGKYSVYLPNHGYVRDCRFDCKPSCKACTSYDTCTLCVDGKYNNEYKPWYKDCRYNCKSNCKSCLSYKNCSSCIEGKYSGRYNDYPYKQWHNDCRHSCRSNCKSCISFDQCTSCINGKYSGRFHDNYTMNEYKDCRHSCKSDCVSCTSYDMCLACVEGKYIGRQYDNPNFPKFNDCRLDCQSNCKSCLSFNKCTACKGGKYSGRKYDSWRNAVYDDCRHNCQSSCRLCTSFYKCSECVTGRYGEYCENVCGRGCLNNTCNKQTGRCMCLFGFRSNKCNDCATGYFGTNCGNSCRGCVGNNCQRDGKCNSGCKQGFRGEKCDGCEPGKYGYYCNSICDSKCEQCISKTDCTVCKKGYFGEHCQLRCPPHCEYCTSENACLACNPGFFGEICSDECPSNCKDNICTKEDGACFSCNSGFYGIHCDKKCPINCANNTCDTNGNCISCQGDYTNTERNCECAKHICSDSSCSSCNGSTFYVEKNACCPCSKTCKHSQCESASKCSRGCEAGYYGDDCSSRCKNIDPACAECAGHYTKTNGICVKCNVGYYFEKVSNRCYTCPIYCADNVCNPVNGTCMKGCSDGRWGDKCEKECSSSCHQCQQSTGKCLTCKGGKHSFNCTEECSENCNSTRGIGICTIESGACLHGCSSFRRYGMYCENDCSSSCLNQTCDWKTGHCLFGCISGFHGKNCENQCSIMCSKVDKGSSQCNESTGYCFGGCNDGWYGVLCYQKCGDTCINKTCDRESGNCLLGCTNGYKGSKCIQALKGTDDGGKTGMIFGLAAGIVSFILIIIGIALMYFIRKRRNNKAMGKGHNSNENRHDNIAVTFSEIQAGEIEFEQNNAVYARPNKPMKREEESTATNKTNNNFASINVIDTEGKREIKQNDAVYARPNKQKKGDVAGDQHYKESPTDNSDNDSGSKNLYDEITKSDDDNFRKSKTRIKPPIKTKATVVYENSGIRTSASKNSRAKYNTRQFTSSVLEIEEDLINLTALTCTSNTALSQEDSRTKDTEADYAYYNVADVKKRKVPIDKLEEYVSELTRKDFEEEFDKLPPGLIRPYTESQKKANLTKNRYKGIYPYDKTRVVLSGEGSDYINASFIDGYKKIKAYIASIGPTYKYMEDMSPFWRMVWQEKVGKIVMLTNLSEAGEPKCDQYWPEKDCSELFNDILVTSDREDIYADYTIRSFTLQKDSEVRSIVQAHFTAWPDKGTPDDVTSLVEFRQKVNSLGTDLHGPILVHCSAGIGRTGTYISIDSLVQEGEAEGGVDIYACVRNLREHRVNMVQTAGQYQYLHNAVVHTLTFACKPVKASMFHEYMSTHTTEHLGNQFQHLQASIEIRSDDETEAVRLNKKLKDKNRTDADIPGHICRPRLYLRRKQGMSGYINALYINSFRTKNRFLVAQTPLPNTVEDFLTLIVQENVSCIVTMEPRLNGNKTVGTYYPDDSQPLKVGSCTVQSEMAECTKQYVERKLKILYQGKSSTQEVTVTHIQFTKWIERQKPPDDPKMFMRFVKDVELKCDGDDMERPILVHCLTGAEKSGLFCVVSILLEKIQLEQEISVVNTVRQVKNRRHKSIPNKEQYIFCHQCLDEYLQTFDTYSNFCLER